MDDQVENLIFVKWEGKTVERIMNWEEKENKNNKPLDLQTMNNQIELYKQLNKRLDDKLKEIETNEINPEGCRELADKLRKRQNENTDKIIEIQKEYKEHFKV